MRSNFENRFKNVTYCLFESPVSYSLFVLVLIHHYRSLITNKVSTKQFSHFCTNISAKLSYLVILLLSSYFIHNIPNIHLYKYHITLIYCRGVWCKGVALWVLITMNSWNSNERRKKKHRENNTWTTKGRKCKWNSFVSKKIEFCVRVHFPLNRFHIDVCNIGNHKS